MSIYFDRLTTYEQEINTLEAELRKAEQERTQSERKHKEYKCCKVDKGKRLSRKEIEL